jgi:hypothetical protein
MTSEYQFLEEKLSGTAGLYATDLALIRLGRDESYWADENEPTLDRLAVFVHEYAHYLHNFSTITGVYGFLTSLRRFRLFANTVDEAGRGRGSEVLKPLEQTEYQHTTRLRTHMAGSLAMPHDLRDASREALEIVDWEFHTHSVTLVSQTEELRGVRIRIKAGDPHAQVEGKFELGAHVLSESVAWEMERVLFESQQVDLSSLESVPTWPYKFARRFLEHATGQPVDSRLVCRVVLLALQCTDPGVAFVHLAGALKDRGVRSFDEVIDAARLQCVSELTRILPGVIELLRKEIEPFAERRPLHRALTRLVDSAIQLLALRAERTFFEIEVVQKESGQALVELIKTFPPCPIIHAVDGGEEIFYLSDAEPDPVNAKSLGVTQTALQFAALHYRPNEILATDSVPPRPCRFFGSCRAPQAASAPERCSAQPWTSFDPSLTEQCWFGQGVAVTRSYRPAEGR